MKLARNIARQKLVQQRTSSIRAGGGSFRFPPRTFTYPYPDFPYSTISRFRAKSDFSGVSAQPVDTPSPGNPYGNATAPRFTFASGGWTLLQAALTSAGPIDVRNGSIRVNLKPAANTFNLSQFNLKLFSTTTVLSPGSNAHQLAMASRVGSLWTGNGATSGGNWQSFTAPFSAATMLATGADPTSIRHIQISGFGACAFDLGDIEFVPNPRTKGGVIISADDGDDSQFTDLLTRMNGDPFTIFPSPLSTVINGGGHLTTAHWKAIMDAGNQSGSQGFTTEDVTTIDNWTKAQRYAEWQGIRDFHIANNTGHVIDADDGSWMSNFGPKDQIGGPDFKANFRTACNFTGGQATGNPTSVSETFPPGDRYNIVRINLNTWGDVPDIYESHIFNSLEQTRACFGLCPIAFHNEMGLASSNYRDAIDKIRNYVNVLHPDEMEFTTIRRVLAPFTTPVDPLTG